MKSEKEKYEKESLRFIDRLYRDLYLNKEVLRHAYPAAYRADPDNFISTDKFNNLRKYLKMLEEMHDRVLKSKSRKEIIKRLYHDRYVIRYKDIPKSYYQTYIKMNLDRGFGFMKMEDLDKEDLASIIIEDQKKSLDDWLDYFLSKKSSAYPFWVKYWAFQGLLRLGKYDKVRGTYNRRTSDTIAPFVELNSEALALSMDLVIKTIKKETIDDDELKRLAESGSFEKIYLHELSCLLKNNNNELKRNEGKWVRYKKGSDYLILVNSLRGYNTGWCTAGEETAKFQLEFNDFDVYYTLNSNNEYKVPRIAILHRGPSISEIRGIEKEQEIEPELLEVAHARAHEICPYVEFFEEEANTRKLTEIYYKQMSHTKLTDEELKFLYNTDMIKLYVDGDERIDYIIKKRNQRKDLAKVYGYKENEIALSKSELNENTKVYVGEWDYDDGIQLPDVVIGNVNLRGVTTTEGLKLPRIVRGDLDLGGLTNAEGLVLPEIVTKDLYMGKVVKATGMILPRVVGDRLSLWDIETLEGIKMPEVLGSLALMNPKGVNTLVLPERMDNLDFRSVTNVSGVVFPKYMSKNLELFNVVSIENTLLPEYVEGDVLFYKLQYAKNGVFPKIIGGDLSTSKLISAENVIFPKEVFGSLYLSNLVMVNNVTLPEYVGEDVSLDSLEDGNGITLPRVIKGTLELNDKLDLSSVILPDEVNGIVKYGHKRITLKYLKKLQAKQQEQGSRKK